MKKIFFISIMMLSCFIISGGITYADGATFSMQPLAPDSKEPQNGYYDLTVTPNEKKELTIRIFNAKSEDIKVKVESNNASTNDNGITSYLKQSEKEEDKTLKIPFSEITMIDKTNPITIPANSSIDVNITIQVPEESFQGIILGGIRVTAVEEKKNDEKKAAITSKIAYTVGVVLKEETDEILPDMRLLGVETEQRNARNYISANLQNAAPTMVEKLEVNAQVYKKDGQNILYEASNNTMRMAPNSNFNFGISLENQPFKSGNYTMKVSGKADGKNFSFEEDFEISSQKAKEWNKNAVHVEKNFHFKFSYIVLLFLVVIVITVLIYFLVKQRNKK